MTNQPPILATLLAAGAIAAAVARRPSPDH